MIYILNKHFTFYVGRGSPLGNPFVIGPDGSREEVIEKYRIYLDEQVSLKNLAICSELNKIYKAALKNDISLICYCVPAACHAGIIQNVIFNKAKLNGKIQEICKDRNS